MTEEEEQMSKELFEAYDYDATGNISTEELLEMLNEQKFVLDDKVRDKMISCFAADPDGITFGEFVRIYRAILYMQPSSVRKQKVKVSSCSKRIDVKDLRELEANARAAFEAVDADHSGELEVDEMKEVLRMTGLPDVDGDDYDGVVLDHMHAADTNQDGCLNFEEFVEYRNQVVKYWLQQSKQENAEAGSTDPEEDPWAWQNFVY